MDVMHQPNQSVEFAPQLPNIKLNEELGQHLIVDDNILEAMAENVTPGAHIIEVGSGPGNLTSILAERAQTVYGVEIDARFEPHIEAALSESPNVEIAFSDVLDIDLRKEISKDPEGTWQLFANLPFHISEPFLRKLKDLPIQNAMMIVGENLAEAMTVTNSEDPQFSRTGLLTKTFFDVNIIQAIDRSSFYPAPRTDTCLVELVSKKPWENTQAERVLRYLFERDSKPVTVRAGVNHAQNISTDDKPLRNKKDRNRQKRRQLNRELKEMTDAYRFNESLDIKSSPQRGLSLPNRLGLPNKILDTPFNQLDNHQLRKLAAALEQI